MNQEDVLGNDVAGDDEILSIFKTYKNSSHDMLHGYRFLTTPAAARKFKDVTHCIFDLDGTVLDSEVIYHKMLNRICKSYNRKYPKELQNRIYGGTDRQICELVQRELKLPISVNELEKQLNDQTKKLLPSAPLQPGAERLLLHLHDHNIPLALATNSTEQAVRLHSTARPKLFGLFHHKVSVSDKEVDRGKPHPDIYFVAAERFPLKPKPKDVVMIPVRRLEREQTRHATLVIRSMLNFQPELFGLPPFPPPKENVRSIPQTVKAPSSLMMPHKAHVPIDTTH